MRAMVTGCAGFIGSHVAQRLLDAGHEVHGLDDLNDAYAPALKHWRLTKLLGRSGFTFTKADLADGAAVESAVRAGPPSVVYNLAARAGVRQSLEDPWVYVRTNVLGTLNILDAARKADVRNVVLASTSSLYGAHNPRPFSESANTDRPLSPYAASKKGAESMVASYAHLYGMNTPVVRYFTVYGPAGRPDMSIFRFIRWIAEGDRLVLHGDGSQERDFTFVEDIARGTISAGTDVRGHEVINLGGDRPVSMRTIIELIEARLGRKAHIENRPLHPADVPATWADIKKARTLLDWEPRVSLEEGIGKTVDWYLQNRAWAKDLPLGAA